MLGLALEASGSITNFAWPLRPAAGRSDLGYAGISNFVDENPAYPGSVLDYNCGDRSYDRADGNHEGTDIFLYPFPWKKLDDEDVVIVAGAAGTIVTKIDGNFDRSCSTSGATDWNAVYVRHADGSIARYGHMKSGSLTVKAVGETVVAGEYLGSVGSSGNSGTPHLHVELHDPAGGLVDPWIGACNAKSPAISWQVQRAYREPAVLALTLGTAAPTIPACPGTETSNDSGGFVTPGSTIVFAAHVREQAAGEPVAVRILRPDGSVFATRSGGGAADHDRNYYVWTFANFPNVPGTWTFEATLAGRTVSRTFEVGGAPGYGSPATITALAGSSQSGVTGTMFPVPLRVQVLDAQSRPVPGARVAFTVAAAPSGATAVLESRSALTGLSGTASVAAIANAKAGTYSVTASVPGVATPAQVTLQNAIPATALTLTPAAIDFVGQSMNTTSPARTVTLTNAGGASVAIASMATSPGYAVTHDCPATLPAGATCAASVSFAPTAEGAMPGALVVQTGAGLQAVAIAGIGERSLVSHYYRSILRRDPDAGGSAFWGGEGRRAQSLGLNVNEVWFAMAQAFYFSAEYAAQNRNNASYVTDLYSTFFNRAPDAGGLAFWVSNLDQGMPREVALSEFMFSAEFRSFAQGIFGNPVVRAEVNAVTDFYRGLLARLPDDGGFNFWLARFRSAQCQEQAAITAEVEAISKAYTDSSEYSGRGRTDAQYVGDLYNAFLRRGGDLGGVLHWIGTLTRSSPPPFTRDQLRLEFKNSPEFQARVAAIVAQGCVP